MALIHTSGRGAGCQETI